MARCSQPRMLTAICVPRRRLTGQMTKGEVHCLTVTPPETAPGGKGDTEAECDISWNMFPLDLKCISGCPTDAIE